MSIRKRKEDGRYFVEVYINGRRQPRRLAATFKEAKAIEQDIRSSVRLAPGRGLEEALAQHLSGGAKALKDYANVLSSARVLRPFIAGKSLRDAGQVADDVKRALTGRFTNSTINRKLSLLRHVCYLAFDWGWTDEAAIGKRVKLLKENPSREVWVTLEQVEALAKLCPLAGNVVRLAAYTGLRKSELLGLQPSNVDGPMIVLSGTTTKNGKGRFVPVPAPAVSLLDDIPFTCTKNVLRVEFHEARVQLGMPNLWFHDLRHSYASVLLQHGIGLEVIGKLLGNDMADRYSHLAPAHLRAAVDLAFTATPTATDNVTPLLIKEKVS